MVKEALQTDDATKYKDGLMSMHSQTESYHSTIFHIIYWSSKLNLSELLVLGGLWHSVHAMSLSVDSNLIILFLFMVQVDTAGWMERSGKEKGPASLSVVQSRKNLMRAHIVALVLDAEKVLTFILICRDNYL